MMQSNPDRFIWKMAVGVGMAIFVWDASAEEKAKMPVIKILSTKTKIALLIPKPVTISSSQIILEAT
jgi:hypothetical protein